MKEGFTRMIQQFANIFERSTIMTQLKFANIFERSTIMTQLKFAKFFDLKNARKIMIKPG
jgi:hypothetical protein